MVDAHDVTVVIPTFQRENDILRCADSLTHQDVSGFEVIIVDNADSPSLSTAVAAINPGAARAVRYVPEPNPGVHNARHAGAQAAAGRLLLFADDDVVCAPGWVRAYCEVFAADEIAAAGGAIVPHWIVQPADWLVAIVRRSDSFSPLALMEPDRESLGDRAYFFSANMAIRRDVLFAVGGFHPEAYGPIWLGDGETGLNLELWRRGLPVRYVPDAIVYHRIPPERMTLGYLRHRMRNQGAADVYTQLHPFDFRRRGIALVTVAAARTGWRSWVASLIRWRRTDERSVLIHLRAATKAGELLFALRLLRSQDLWPLVKRQRWLETPEAQRVSDIA